MAARPHLSKARRAGSLVFVSGQLALDGSGMLAGDTLEEQTACCLRSIEAILKDEGIELGDIIKPMVWLARGVSFARLNNAYAEFFSGVPPARSTVIADRVVLGAKIEIEAIAVCT